MPRQRPSDCPTSRATESGSSSLTIMFSSSQFPSRCTAWETSAAALRCSTDPFKRHSALNAVSTTAFSIAPRVLSSAVAAVS